MGVGAGGSALALGTVPIPICRFFCHGRRAARRVLFCESLPGAGPGALSAVEEDVVTQAYESTGFIAPDPESVKGAWVQDWRALEEQALKDPQGYWAGRARELEWSRPWEEVLDDSEAPFYRWFVGARTNIVTNAVDRHLVTARKNKLALVWVGEDTDQVRTFSYFSLAKQVERMANVLKAMGVGKGDVVTIYLPRIPRCSSPCWPAPSSAPSTRWSSPATPPTP